MNRLKQVTSTLLLATTLSGSAMAYEYYPTEENPEKHRGEPGYVTPPPSPPEKKFDASNCDIFCRHVRCLDENYQPIKLLPRKPYDGPYEMTPGGGPRG